MAPGPGFLSCTLILGKRTKGECRGTLGQAVSLQSVVVSKPRHPIPDKLLMPRCKRYIGIGHCEARGSLVCPSVSTTEPRSRLIRLITIICRGKRVHGGSGPTSKPDKFVRYLSLALASPQISMEGSFYFASNVGQCRGASIARRQTLMMRR